MKSRKGSALATVLLASLALFTLLKVLIIVSHGSGFRSRTHQDRLLAGYAMEAGAADAISHLNDFSGWVVGFEHQKMPHCEAWYSLHFAPSGSSPGPLDSVNNLGGTAPVDGPRGPATVPPGCADLVVIAGAGAIERRCLVFVTSNLSQSFSTGLLSSNRILMSGDVDVSGITDLETGQSVNADLHSNKPGTDTGVIQWDGTGSCNIQGKVSATSNSAGAIQMPGANIVGGTQTNAAAKPAPAVDIPALIAANSGQTPLTVPPVGSATVSAGTYYINGDLSIDGDLLLQGAEIYVTGNVRVNGSLGGSGKIYSNGQTRLQGDTQLSGADGLALFSRGSVELSGFNGTEYLDAMSAADPAFAGLSSQLQNTLQQMQDMFASTPAVQMLGSGALHDRMETLMGDLGGAYRGNNLAGQVASLLATKPAGRTRDFMIQKMRDLQRIGDDGNGTGQQHWEAGDHRHAGVLNEALHQADPALLKNVAAALAQYDINQLGSTFFQGTIYTNGYIYAGNDVTVVGAVVANDNGSQAPGMVDGQLLEPGDIVLKRSVQFTLNQQAAEALGGPGPAPATGEVRQKSWIEL